MEEEFGVYVCRATKSSHFLSLLSTSPGDQLAEIYQEFIQGYPIVSIEDCFDQDDWEAWTRLTEKTEIQIVGDDLLVTNPKRIKVRTKD